MTGGGATLVALTGATGFLGSHIADLLLARGCRVRASVRPTSSLRWLEGTSVETMRVQIAAPVDGAEDDSLEGFVRGADAVIHCAGVVKAPDLEGYRRGNVETTRRLLDAATAAGCRDFVLVSSLAAVGPAPLGAPVDEDSPYRPITDYGRSKREGEEVVLAAGAGGPRCTILRPPALYGPRDVAFVPLLRFAMKGWTAQLGGRVSGLSLVDGRDAAAAVVALLESEDATGPFFVDDGHAYSWQDLVEALEFACGRRVQNLRIPMWPLQLLSKTLGRRLSDRILLLNHDRLADLTAPGWVCDGSRLRERTAYRPAHGLGDGMADALAFYREAGWLS